MGLFSGKDWGPENYKKIADGFYVSYENPLPSEYLDKGLILVTDNSLACKNDLHEKMKVISK